MALPANLVVIPLVFLVVPAGCLSLLLGSCVWVLAEIFNHANLALVWVLSRTMQAVRAIPGGSVDIAQPCIWPVLAWYFVLGSLALYLRGSRGSAFAKGSGGTSCSPFRRPDQAQKIDQREGEA